VARTLAACLVMIAGIAARAGATTIADIVAAPESYNGQQVTVTGTVADPRSAYVGDIVYNLSAGALRITVFGRGTLPAVGDHVTVDAKVGWREGDEEFTWPPILFESSRQTAP
jgi:starvation-inducible outer membrane lipoprotein